MIIGLEHLSDEDWLKEQSGEQAAEGRCLELALWTWFNGHDAVRLAVGLNNLRGLFNSNNSDSFLT